MWDMGKREKNGQKEPRGGRHRHTDRKTDWLREREKKR
jgi:hypothetical protein